MSTVASVVGAIAMMFSSHGVDPEELRCLTNNIYYEARGEGFDGMVAVGLVTLNRVNSPRYPNTFCKVVHDPYQFSWTVEKRYPIKNIAAYGKAAMISARILSGEIRYDNFRADHYFNPSVVQPKWAKRLRYEGRIKSHVFYSSPNMRVAQVMP